METHDDTLEPAAPREGPVRELRVEARAAPQDIDQLRLGQPAMLRFSAFNQRIKRVIWAFSICSGVGSHSLVPSTISLITNSISCVLM